MNKIEKRDLENLEIHELADLTPTMTEPAFNTLKDSIESNGQRVPIVIWKNKVIDGRHRCRALRELGKTEVLCEIEDSNKTEEDIRVLVLQVLENRRHQTTTQKAIMGYREYVRAKNEGVKMSLGAAAELVGSTRLQISRARDLAELTGDHILNLLFGGGKVNIGVSNRPINTDNLLTLKNYFKSKIEDIVDQSKKSKIREDFTDNELTILEDTITDLQSQFSVRMLNKLTSKLYSKISENKPKESEEN